MQRLPIVIAVIAIILIIAGVFLVITRTPKKTGPGATDVPPRTDVTVTENGFSPQTLTVKKGDVVVWINKSKANVTVNSDPHPEHNLYRFLNRGEFPPGSSVQATFDTPGTYTYHNHFNPSQTGTIVVK